MSLHRMRCICRSVGGGGGGGWRMMIYASNSPRGGCTKNEGMRGLEFEGKRDVFLIDMISLRDIIFLSFSFFYDGFLQFFSFLLTYLLYKNKNINKK